MPESRPHPAASSTSARPGERSSAESGMAYVIAVAVLAVLTILGVSLVLVTQAEVVSGGQERTMEKTFYGAEAGLQLSVARALAEGDFSPSVHERASTGLASGELTEIRDRVETSTFICQGEIPCDLCAINQGRSFARRNHVVAVNATRRADDGEGGEVVLGRKSLVTAVDVEPLESAVDCIADAAAATAGYRFDEY